MKKFLLALSLAFGTSCLIIGQGESNFSLISTMDGEIELDGGGTTNVWGFRFNGPGVTTIPAPFLEVMAGDSVHVEFSNPSPESHTIHWHGLDVDQLNDGVPSTSFYVVTGETVDYSFHAPHPGTYLYHCHVTTTIHLTMGMYGMFVVQYPGNLLYEDGPEYDREWMLLASDLEVETNDAPTDAYPFHQIRPDYFMVNGLSGNTLYEAEEMKIKAFVGDQVALRLGSMAYTKVRYIFPEGSNPVAHMSDGRVLPESYVCDTLDIYPGERYTVMLSPDETMETDIQVQYISMINKQIEGENSIQTVNLGFPDDVQEYGGDGGNIRVFPNPASNLLQIECTENGNYSLYDISGKLMMSMVLETGLQTLDLSTLNDGMYFLHGPGGIKHKIILE